MALVERNPADDTDNKELNVPYLRQLVDDSTGAIMGYYPNFPLTVVSVPTVANPNARYLVKGIVVDGNGLPQP